MTLATGHPLHIAFGSIAPQNGFGFGGALVGHDTPNENWRINWSADAVGAIGGAWRAGAYINFVNTIVKPITVIAAPAATAPSAGEIHTYPVYGAYVQTISLPKVRFTALVPRQVADDRAFFGLGEPSPVPTRLCRSTAQGHSTLSWSARRTVASSNLKLQPNEVLIERLYARKTTAAGLNASRDSQSGEGVGGSASLLAGAVSLNYLLQLQQFVAPGDSSYSFRRWTVDLRHEVPIYRNPVRRRRSATRTRRTSARPILRSTDARHLVSRNRTGTVGFQDLLAIERGLWERGPVLLSADGRRLGHQRRPGMLASFDDYRFRGPRLFLLQESIEHSLGSWPAGVSGSA